MKDVWPVTPVRPQSKEPEWWSFKNLRRPALPQPTKPSLAANPIDVFISIKLGEKGLKPAPRADKLTLLRRIYFDLVGLPPTPEEAAKFLTDSSPKAYENLIDNLLASPRYGERWARHWLDVVRYADSAGFDDDDYTPNAWRYRDYVIRASTTTSPTTASSTSRSPATNFGRTTLTWLAFTTSRMKSWSTWKPGSEQRCTRSARRFKSRIWMERSYATSD